MAFNDYLIRAIDKGHNWASKYLKDGKVPLALAIEDARKKGVREELIQQIEEKGMLTGDISMTYEGAKRIYDKAIDGMSEDYRNVIDALDPVKDADLIANAIFCLNKKVQNKVGNYKNLYRVVLTLGSHKRSGHALPIKQKTERRADSSFLTSNLEETIKAIPREEYTGDEEYQRSVRVILGKKAEREAFPVFKKYEHAAFSMLDEKTANEKNENLRDAYSKLRENYVKYFELEIKNLNPYFQDPETGKIGFQPSLHQKSGIYHLAKEKRFGIFDGCGTGKTAIAILAQQLVEENLKNEGKQFRRAVVVCPNSAKITWRKGLLSEKEKYMTDINEDDVAIINGEKKNEDFIKELGSKKWIVLNYEQLTTEVNGSGKLFVDVLKELGIDYLIFDESHNIKSKRDLTKKGRKTLSNAARSLADKLEYVCLMTGSPIPDKMDDYAMMYHLLNPEKCQDLKEFKERYKESARILFTLFNEKTVRRTSEEINESLEWEETSEEMALDPVQRQIYQYLISHRPKNWLTQARKTLLDPRLVDPEILKKAGALGKVGYENSAKYKKLVELLADENGPVKNGEKFVIFSSMFREGVTQKEHQSLKKSYEALGLPEEYEKLQLNLSLDEIMKKSLEKEFGREFKIGIIDGTVTEVSEREKTINGLEDGLAGILCTTDTGGESLNLTSASHVFFLDEDYCPKTTEQALARLIRKGQKKIVKIHHLMGKDTLDEQLKDYVAKKVLINTIATDGYELTDEEKAWLEDAEGKKFAELVKRGLGGVSIDVLEAKIDDIYNFKTGVRGNRNSKREFRLNALDYSTTEAQELMRLIGQDPLGCWSNPLVVELYLKTFKNLAVPVIHRAKICDLLRRAKEGKIEFPKTVLSEGAGHSILYSAYTELSHLIKAYELNPPAVVDRDLSRLMLKNGANPKKIIGCMTGKDSAFKDESFDMVDNESISLLKNPEEVKSALLEANRILKPNGLVELVVKNMRFSDEFYKGMKKLGFEVLSRKNEGFYVGKELFERLKEDYGEHYAEAYASKLANTHLILARKTDKPGEADANSFWFERVASPETDEEMAEKKAEEKENERKVSADGKSNKRKRRKVLPGEINGLPDNVEAFIEVKE